MSSSYARHASLDASWLDDSGDSNDSSSTDTSQDSEPDVTDPFWTVTVDIALDSLRTQTGTQTRH